MVVALIALSLVMIVGGTAAVVQGFPYVRLESGLAMVIGGCTVASAGAVLLGLSALLRQLKHLAATSSARAGAATVPFGESEELLAPQAAAFREPTFEELPPVAVEPRPGLAGAAGLAGVTLAASAQAIETRAPELPSPDPFSPVEPEPLPAMPEPSGPDDDLFAEAEAASPRSEQGPTLPVPPDLRPSLDETTPEPVTAPADPVPEESKPKVEELQVVGTYASGGNTYVMFSNGTIKAETPRGRFTFDSLDELKAFVENGGENPTRGAA